MIVERSGIPVAAIVSAEDFQMLKDSEKRREEAFKAIDRFREAFRDVPDEELEREVTNAVRLAREEIR